jgi:signal transduction histidine kinase
MRKVTFITFILSCFYFHLTFAQQNVIDSLQNVLKTAKEDTNRVNALIALAAQFKSNDPDTAIYFGNNALTLATKLNFKTGMADASFRLGQANVNLGRYEDAIKNTIGALAAYNQLLFAKGPNKKEMLKKKSAVYNLTGQIYYLQGKYAEALKVNSDALKIRTEVGDKFGYSSSLVSIGNIYYAQGDLDNALASYEAALKIRQDLGEKSGIADCYSNIGIIYWEQEKDSLAIKNYVASLNIRKEIGDKKGIATTYNNLGSLYFAIEKYDEALKNYFLALGIRSEIDDRMGVATTCNNIGNIYTKQKKYKDASVYLNKSIALSNEIGSLEDIKEGYQNLTVLDSAQGNYKQALEHYKLYMAFRDSLVNDDNIKKMAEAQMQFELDKRDALQKAQQEKKDAVQKEELQKQKLLRNGIIIGTALLVLLGLLFFSRYHLRKKLEKQEAILKERKRISNDMHDDLASGLTSIRMLSEMAHQKTNQKIEEISKISKSAETLMDNMRDIIWTMSAENNTVEDLVFYIRKYAGEFLDICGIEYRFDIPETIPQVIIEAEKKRNIFLSVKESLHNIVKHSEATMVKLHFNFDKDVSIIIHDNGKGIDSGTLNGIGNGLKNMKSRMQSVNGSFGIENKIGTTITLSCPLSEKT